MIYATVLSMYFGSIEMGIICKKCGMDVVCKNGFVVRKQRYLCKVCGTNFTEGDGRKKHSYRVIRAAVDLYIEGNGFRHKIFEENSQC
jgi:transposase-like protein